MLDPVSRATANAPIEDEEISAEEERAVAGAREWLRHNKAIPHEEVLAVLGLTLDDFERMAGRRFRRKRTARTGNDGEKDCLDRPSQGRCSRHRSANRDAYPARVPATRVSRLAVEEAVKWAPRPDNMIAGRPGFEYHIANLVLLYTWEVIVVCLKLRRNQRP
jgi:hypothetical protein